MRNPVDIVASQFNNLKPQLIRLAPPPFLRALSANTWLVLVFLAISLWLTGPRTNAGAFEFARILVPSEARQLLLEFANNTESPEAFPSIAPAAAAIPSNKIDLAALDAQF
jgi:hypothetical protein